MPEFCDRCETELAATAYSKLSKLAEAERQMILAINEVEGVRAITGISAEDLVKYAERVDLSPDIDEALILARFLLTTALVGAQDETTSAEREAALAALEVIETGLSSRPTGRGPEEVGT